MVTIISKLGGKQKMKKSILKIVILLLGISLTSGCVLMKYGQDYQQAQKYYNQGDYDNAVYKCVDSLKAKSDYAEAISLLKEVAPLAYDKHRDSAEKYQSQNKWDQAVAEYDALLKLNLSVSSLGGDFPGVDVTNIKRQRQLSAQKAAEVHYQKGLSLMKEGKYKSAAIEFRLTQNFIPGYKDSETLYDKVREKASKRVAIMPFENRSGKREFGDIGALMTDSIISKTIKKHPEFMDFVTRDYLQQLMTEQKLGTTETIDPSTAAHIGKVLGLHSFIFGRILSITENYPPRTVTHDSGSTTIHPKEGSSYKVYASWTAYTQKGTVEVTASFQIIDVATGRIVESETLRRQEEDEVQWATFRGDERALPWHIRWNLTREEKRFPEPPEVLVNRAIENLAEDLSTKIVNFFK